MSSSPYSLSFGSQPSILPSYARIVFGRKQPIVPDGLHIPRLEAELRTYRPKRSRVEDYRAVCGGTPSDYLPAAYPHVIATPIQLALLSSIAFPVRLMGLVHLRNHIEHYRPIHVDETLQLRTYVDGRRDTDRGQEFDVNTTVFVDGKPAWAEVCVFMARRLERDTSKPFGARISAGEGVPAPDAEAVAPLGPDSIVKTALTADKGVGWRYAKVSSDYNPIHLWDFGARMFGFNQAIAHGMWSMARCLAALPAGTFDSACRADVVFKRPVSIPAPLTLETWRTPAGDGFALKGAGKGKVHLAGSVTPLRTATG
jgi:acyl dehydratase